MNQLQKEQYRKVNQSEYPCSDYHRGAAKPEFGTVLAEAKAAGVQVLFLLCHVGRDSLEIVEQREG